MFKERDLYVRQVVVAAMGPEERLLSINRTRSSETMYVCLVNQQDLFVTFRVSYHMAGSGFLSIPTFAMSHLEKFEAEIHNYLPKASWTPLTYSDYFMLSVLTYSHVHHILFQIDDLYSIFAEEKEAMIFYQVRESYKKKHIEVNGLSAGTNQVMRKLFAFGLISSHQVKGETPGVYVSAMGMRLLDYYADTYVEQFMQDYQDLDWNRVVLPDEVLSDQLDD